MLAQSVERDLRQGGSAFGERCLLPDLSGGLESLINEVCERTPGEAELAREREAVSQLSCDLSLSDLGAREPGGDKEQMLYSSLALPDPPRSWVDLLGWC